MQCPFCLYDVPQIWQKVYTRTNELSRELQSPTESLVSEIPGQRRVAIWLRWMQCPNEECRQILVEIEAENRGINDSPFIKRSEKWFAVPRTSEARPIDSRVPDTYRRDYIEASRILDASPRMSAVLSRRILSDLLKEYANRKEYNLASRIDKFIEDTAHPSHTRENLHHLREIADFGAHTQTDQSTGEIIEVTREEAEWTLEVVDGLFDYFITAPARDAERRAAFEKKIEAAGRKPLKKPPDLKL